MSFLITSFGEIHSAVNEYKKEKKSPGISLKLYGVSFSATPYDLCKKT